MNRDKTTGNSAGKRAKRGVTHDARPEDAGIAHVVLKLDRGLSGLRKPRMHRIVKRAIRKAEGAYFAVLEYSILDNHLHFIVEAGGKTDLSRGMQGFAIRLAKGFNKAWHRKGKVFRERYFARFVHKVNELRRLLRYVLQNARKHGIPLPPGQPDPYSSAPWFRWLELRGKEPPEEPRPTRRGQGMAMYAAMQWVFSLFDLPGPREYPDAVAFEG